MTERLRAALKRLYDAYGDRIHQTHPTGKPLDVLVQTILSQHTSDTNSERAFRALRRTYPDWPQVLAADSGKLAEIIHSGGLANIKAQRIQQVLAHIQQHDHALTLDHLVDLTSQECYCKLLAMPGVGRKTAACVILFSLEKAAFPVDTHVFRVMQRLGVPPKISTPEQTTDFLEAGIPADQHLRAHCTLITHGRTICKARNPACSDCPAVLRCRTGSKKVKKKQS